MQALAGVTRLLLPKPQSGAGWNRDCQSLSSWHDRLWVQPLVAFSWEGCPYRASRGGAAVASVAVRSIVAAETPKGC